MDTLKFKQNLRDATDDELYDISYWLREYVSKRNLVIAYGDIDVQVSTNSNNSIIHDMVNESSKQWKIDNMKAELVNELQAEVMVQAESALNEIEVAINFINIKNGIPRTAEH